MTDSAPEPTLSTYRIDVHTRQIAQAAPQHLTTAHQHGITTLTSLQHARLFFIRGDLTESDVRYLSEELLADPVTETFTINQTDHEADHVTDHSADHIIEVTLQPGVTDPVAENLLRAIQMLGIDGIDSAATGQRYLLQGDLSARDLQQLATKVLSNPVIQRHTINQAIDAPFIATRESDGLVETIPIRDADDDALLRISAERRLSLDVDEMQAIQAWYDDADRDPTDIELEMLAQTWSEHCVHKTFQALIHFEDEHGDIEDIDGLLKTYIRGATEKIDAPWIRSAFVDNAGIVAFNDEYDLAFKVETHNHPSALEPFGGANTGVGGVVRDILGVSARPIANTDVLCFGPQDLDESDLLQGVLHPRRVQDGVVHGIEDYGNKMGIPTVNGAVLYDEGYTANPLVYCGCLGILPRDSHRTTPQPGDYIVVLGGRTGRDGLRGATFSSMEMDTNTGDIASISVQIGHPINEKQVQEVILRARDEDLYNAITDCGAGGLSSAVGEMGENLGAEVQLKDIPLKYPGLRPWEIWLSEAQERMVLAVAPEHWSRLKDIADGQNVEATRIGTFGSDDVRENRRLLLRYGDDITGDITMGLLHDCRPRRELFAQWQPPAHTAPEPLTDDTEPDIKETLLALLAHPNIRSKEDIVRRYDHEVQAGTVVKPLVGVDYHGPGNSSVILPLDTLPAAAAEASDHVPKGVALSVGICPQYGEYDPYAMAWAAVDEAFRNLVAVGADPDQVALLDNFCWGNPNLPDRLGSLVLAAKGCHDAALAYNAPFVSGKDSLNNEYADEDGTRHAIPGTLLISAMGVVPDVSKTVTMDLKQPGNVLFAVGVAGQTSKTMGGSHYHKIHGMEGGTVPQPLEKSIDTMRKIYQGIQQGLIKSCHDVSEGGLLVALAEMCIAGRLGLEMDNLDYGRTPRAEFRKGVLFSEKNGNFIVEIAPDDKDAFLDILADAGGVPYDELGTVTADPVLQIAPFESDKPHINISVAELERAFRGEHLTPTADAPPETPVIERPERTRSTRQGIPRVLILHANGTNRDRDAALACDLAGGDPDIVHINQLLSGARHLLDYHMLVIPGGFSYGDDLGAGQLWAQNLRHQLRDDLERFALNGRPVLGICNGFQVLLKSGLLPHTDFARGDDRNVTLTCNERGQFECRPVYLKATPNSASLFTEGMSDLILCPVAHGEGRVVARDAEALQRLWQKGHVALTYVNADGAPVGYPGNPNGSQDGIAALCNTEGNVMGLMPHPEDHIFPWQHPHYQRGARGQSGLVLFKNGIHYA